MPSVHLEYLIIISQGDVTLLPVVHQFYFYWFHFSLTQLFQLVAHVVEDVVEEVWAGGVVC